MGIEEQVRAFESEVGAVLDGARACVRRLREAADDNLQYLIAERLAVLGSSIIPDLNEIVVDPSSDRNGRYLAARVAISVGDRGESVHVLCAEVEAGSVWAVPAAGVLGRHGLAEGREPILRALERVDPRHGSDVIGYVQALRELRGDLPDRLRLKLLTESDPWIARAVEQDFPR